MDNPEDEMDDDSSEGVNVPTPKGFDWPKGVDPKEGDRFMCMVKQGPDGQLTILDIDGLPLGEDMEDDTDDAPTSAMDAFTKGKASLMGN